MVLRLSILALAAAVLLGGCGSSDRATGPQPSGQAWLIDSMITVADRETIQVYLFRYDVRNRNTLDSSILQGGRGFVIRRTFDEADRPIREDQEEGGTVAITEWTYTSFGKIATRRSRDTAGMEYGRDTSEYDGYRRLIRETVYAYGGATPSSFVLYRYAGPDTLVDTVFHLDSAGAQTSKTIHTYSGDNVVESWSYAEEGAFRLTNRYGKAGNLLEAVSYGKDGTVMARVTLEYDRNGNPSKWTHKTETPNPQSNYILYRWKKALE